MHGQAPAIVPVDPAVAESLLTPKAVTANENRLQPLVLPEAVATKIQTFTAGPAGEPPRLWQKKELAQLLTRAEKSKLAAALTQLEKAREMLRLPVGRGGQRFLFARSLRQWLDGVSPAASAPAEIIADASAELVAAYEKAVRISGGFPDVKISILRAALTGESAGGLDQQLRTLWSEGQVTLSLGDWSLASEEMRAAAIELDGERYLLVRFEDPAAEPLPA